MFFSGNIVLNFRSRKYTKSTKTNTETRELIPRSQDIIDPYFAKKCGDYCIDKTDKPVHMVYGKRRDVILERERVIQPSEIGAFKYRGKWYNREKFLEIADYAIKCFENFPEHMISEQDRIDAIRAIRLGCENEDLMIATLISVERYKFDEKLNRIIFV
ncbi:hypothetical protein [Powai lake megavirus]|uniref:Uncharacterized protein n=1 Tax=Powai lake megavirus TaxID=1842663 RepID=A0A167RKT6_9VIRU|nr:hypothetical protein QJ849_gp641 [Powai lake megavirus]ANB50803.1 hypothetical protein [Powai lake megavirus]